MRSGNEPFWLDEAMIRAMHADQQHQHGGLSGSNENLIQATLARPKNLFVYGELTPTIFELAAAYCYGFAKNHAFVDGNKRLSFVAMATFLELNGYSFDAPEVEVVVMMEGIASSEETQESLAVWIQKNSIEYGE
ncbi:type II toxin-antitoxin system death-on-curing family toxin [Brasilonema octagenarum UFV-E1]|uniref:Type II toxin-antitoxin system death-on-curing family toxin n=1 Tax=Brasilonema sennae CENA114 TaxID=415709 RepID=A0A856MNL8_9CYAN|nr:type II toxin-antitoxin system death-on-curing family toxin [Brasilonema sennae]QDL11680.1 type II toxin-antitoxin system death-on-curing family toxin [Brasilonema sennae CENA114]QDL18060.1 type II toxin-antitoxin system death-on-curing family toxin [Brasilonema octagenarum UFV-E1]